VLQVSDPINSVDRNGTKRQYIKPGLSVDIILKQDQRTGKKTRGIVREILTGSSFHPHGIKVRLTSGHVGRVCFIHPDSP
jgi:uncharacterized repeat protein (TIGR03833 family)